MSSLHLLTLKLFQTYMNLFLLLNTKEDIVKKNMGNQTKTFFFLFFKLWKSTGWAINCLVTHYSSKYLLLCSAEEKNTLGLLADNVLIK